LGIKFYNIPRSHPDYSFNSVEVEKPVFEKFNKRGRGGKRGDRGGGRGGGRNE